jgi:hypothetical protein
MEETFKLRIDENGKTRYALTVGKTYFVRPKDQLVPEEIVYMNILSSTTDPDRAGKFTGEEVNAVSACLQRKKEKNPTFKYPEITVE